MGGLVCRTFIKRHPDRWKTMWDAERNGERGGRLVMLGTPNHGSYLTLQRQGALAGQVQATQPQLGQRIRNLTGKGVCFPQTPH